MSDQASCADTPNATFSPGLADGPLPWILPDGREICPFGLALALASLSARQVKEMGLQISGISGRPGSISSASADLSTSLASRLRAQLGTDGSILYRQTWKQRTTPSGALYWEHTASALRTSDSDCIGWLTPRARGDAGGKRWRDRLAKNLEDQARIYALMCGLTDTEVARLSLSATFVRHLMGYPAEWDACAPTETRSSRKRHRRSSAPSSKRESCDLME